MLKCDVLNPTGDFEADVKTLAESVPPILNEFWEARGREWYRVETLRIDAVFLAQMWSSRATRLILARDGGTVVGLLMGTSLTTFLHGDRVFQVEMYWGRTPEVEAALLAHLAKGLEFMPERYVSLPDYGGKVEVAGLVQLAARTHSLCGRT
jgi:hypothetical protein